MKVPMIFPIGFDQHQAVIDKGLISPLLAGGLLIRSMGMEKAGNRFFLLITVLIYE